jgi:hypothetical protein
MPSTLVARVLKFLIEKLEDTRIPSPSLSKSNCSEIVSVFVVRRPKEIDGFWETQI